MNLYRVPVHHNGTIRIIMARKRKPNQIRTESGRISRAQSADEMRAQAEKALNIENRVRHSGLDRGNALRQEAGYPMGVLFLQGHLSRDQHDALMMFWDLRHRYLGVIDARSETAKSPGFDLVARGLPVIPDIDCEDEAKRERAVRRAFADARSAIMDSATGVPNGGRFARVIRIVCHLEKATSLDDIVALREAGNILHRLWWGHKRRAAS